MEPKVITTEPTKARSSIGGLLTRGLFRGMPRVYTYAIVGGTMALLIWMKLRVVTGVPRTAYADPEGKPSHIAAPARPAPSGGHVTGQVQPGQVAGHSDSQPGELVEETVTPK